MKIENVYLVGGFTPVKNISQIGSSSQLLGKIKFMFQTTKQVYLVVHPTGSVNGLGK